LLIKNNKKREVALKNEAGGDEKHLFFFTWPYRQIGAVVAKPSDFGIQQSIFTMEITAM